MKVTVIGTGAVGGAVVRLLLAGGHGVTVWNRTRHRVTDLVAAGAAEASSVADAVGSGSLVLLCLTDYAAVRSCLAGAETVLSGRTVVAVCTGTAQDARDAAKHVTGLGGQYLDAGLQTSPDTLGTDRATILYSGDRGAFEHHRSTLALLSPPRFVGTAPDAAATWDLALFGVWYDAQVGILRALDIARRAGIDVTEFAATAGTSLGHVVAALPDTANELLTGTCPAGPATLTEHLAVIGHLIGQRAGHPVGDGGLAAVAARTGALVAAGRAEEGLTSIVTPDR
jgi:3-hydroxyisobutyrate dehydrogenase-like beta-hydroxyacid dehydrogenase